MHDLPWLKSSYSGGAENCTEVAQSRENVYVRDTKDRDGGLLDVPAASWRSFLETVGK
ncbi:MAG: hypothetical protein JWQ81_6140 [Amycolatopsis sp.]|uniref:DUF397 domain-containing protein n=1 Tax=Amycolatopsis sp. TaxID=37632 RepID=UPI0026224DBA|nr:DUF397 domain-containing protein [Amycolatopsis sp.]MCU1685401.1 hypothetical protein [Amycolatopsis sp.]